MRQALISLIVSVLTTFYSLFPGAPLPDMFRKYFPPEDCVQIYQLAPDPDSLIESYVIKTANNKIIVIDGGTDGTGKENEPYLPSAIRAILGLKQNEYFEIEGWFVSHAHSDHFYELAKMLKSYNKKSNYKINNFYFNFPDIGVEWNSVSETDAELDCMQVLHDGFDNYFRVNGLIDDSVTDRKAAYKSVNGKVINDEAVDKGLTVEIDGVCIDVLLNWDKSDLIINSTSVVFRLRYKEHSILFLGDSYTDTEKRLLEKYSPDELKSEYVQMAHHGQNGTSREFYDAIDIESSIRLWPSPQWLWNADENTPYQINQVKQWVGVSTDTVGTKDIVAGIYDYYPKKPTKTKCWNKAVLDAQWVVSFT